MSEARFRFLSQEDVVAAGGLDVAATIHVVEEALRLHAEGDTRLPSKSALLWSDELIAECAACDAVLYRAELERNRAELARLWQRDHLCDLLQKGQQIFQEVLDVRPVAFRAPCCSTCDALYEALGDERMKPPAQLLELQAEGKLGRKSGEGFFRYGS